MFAISKAWLRAACMVTAVALPMAAGAQGVTGTLFGTVKDPQGGVIPGASVTLINEAQGTRSALQIRFAVRF